MRQIKFAESEEYSCENCLHFHILFGRVNRMKLGKLYANGWCYNKETKQPFYTANNMVCENFQDIFENWKETRCKDEDI